MALFQTTFWEELVQIFRLLEGQAGEFDIAGIVWVVVDPERIYKSVWSGLEITVDGHDGA